MNEEQKNNVLRNMAIWREIVGKLNETAVLGDPEKLAYVIYFLMKQYPNNDIFNAMYQDFLVKTKRACVEIFGWDMREVHECLCILNGLTKYSKKKLDKS